MRFFVAEDGMTYRVTIVPMERRGSLGVDQRLNAVVYETPQGRWVGSVPVYHTIMLDALTDADLEELLDQAIGRG